MAAPDPGPVPREALDYFAAKRLKVSFDYREIWRDEHAEQFTVAKLTQLEVLQAAKQSLLDALARGETFRSWQKAIRPELERSGWWGARDVVDESTGEVRTTDLSEPRRLRTIYETNMRQARAAGQWQRIERTKRALPYLLYQVGPSVTHREEHLSWHGLVLPADDPWWQTHMPMNGWGCKCHVRQVGPAEFDRLQREGLSSPVIREDPETGKPQAVQETRNGLPTGRLLMEKRPIETEAPPIIRRPWKNRHTGKIEQVPVGIDPGFDANPGIRRLDASRRIAELERSLAPDAGDLNAG